MLGTVQERFERRVATLCHSFLSNKCHWGDKCKFSHDVESFVRTKPADLPGQCPFSCLEAECQYGV